MVSLTDCSNPASPGYPAAKPLRAHEEEALRAIYGGFARTGGSPSDENSPSYEYEGKGNEVVVWKRWRYEDLSSMFSQTSSRQVRAALSSASSLSFSSAASKESLSATAALLMSDARSVPFPCKIVQYRGRPPPGRAHAHLLCDTARAAGRRIATPVAAAGRGSAVEQVDFRSCFIGAAPRAVP